MVCMDIQPSSLFYLVHYDRIFHELDRGQSAGAQVTTYAEVYIQLSFTYLMKISRIQIYCVFVRMNKTFIDIDEI